MEVSGSTSIVKEVPETDNKACPDMSFWTPGVLELVELVLKPLRGGPPSLPEQSDAVLFLFHHFHVFFVIYLILVD